MQVMNAKEAAKMLGITYSQLWRIMSSEGSKPPYVMVGVRKRFIRSEVEKWLLENQVPGTQSGKSA
jgi:predicted DNA-binding transcriptional regulator AlpA